MSQHIRTVAVIGCGVIGASWATLFLSRGLKVIMSDPAEGAEEAFKRYLRDAWPALQAGRALEDSLAENYEFVDDVIPKLPEVDFVQEVGIGRHDSVFPLIRKLFLERTRACKLQAKAHGNA